MRPKIKLLFKRLAKLNGFTDQTIWILPRQGEHCPGPVQGHAVRDQLSPSVPPLCGLSWQEGVLAASGALAGHTVQGETHKFLLSSLFWVLNGTIQTTVPDLGFLFVSTEECLLGEPQVSCHSAAWCLQCSLLEIDPFGAPKARATKNSLSSSGIEQSELVLELAHR